MATRMGLGKISEEGLTGNMAPEGGEANEAEQETMNEEIESSMDRKQKRKTKSRKVSVFSPEMKKNQNKSSFSLVHTDHPVASRVTFAPPQSENSEYSVRRISGHENSMQHRHIHRATYQTGPHKEFSVSQVQKIIKETFENGLASGDAIAPRSVLCKNLAEAIKMKTRRLNYDRYRIIVHVFICSKDNVTLKITSRCVWDDKIDNYADYTYETTDFYALGIAYGVYKE